MQVASFLISDPKMADWQKIGIFLYLIYGDLSAASSQTIDASNLMCICHITGHHRWAPCPWQDFGLFQGGPFPSQISGLNDLTWTCLCKNIPCYGPLMHVASFWISDPRWPTGGKIGISLYLTYGDLSAASTQDWMTLPRHAYARTFHVMGHWWT